jgi:acyl-coenzyme A synthetase/AMP-(fatty) acid ligase
MRGYWEATEATFERFRPGPLPREVRCYTGDLFRQDTDGFFYFVSRKDDIIKCKGQKVAPKEIEDVLHQVNGVIHAAVVGVPDPIFGQAIKAVLVVEDGVLSAKEVQAYCRAHLEDFMVPKYVEVRPVLPMTTSGKIKKRELV